MTKKTEGPVRAALFDVDGTLADTNYLHTVTWWEAFAQAGHVVPMADIHRAIGMGSGLMLDKLLPPDRDEDADADIRTAHTALYSTYWSRLRPLPGAADLLRACCSLIICARDPAELGRAAVQLREEAGGAAGRGHPRYAPSSCTAALMTARWDRPCGMFPRKAPDEGSISSANSPRSLA
jgi:haloacid dehalogenase-like hydrolase